METDSNRVESEVPADSWESLADGQELEELRALCGSLKNLPEPKLPESLSAESLMAKHSRLRARRVVRLCFTAAAVFAVVVAVNIFGRYILISDDSTALQGHNSTRIQQENATDNGIATLAADSFTLASDVLGAENISAFIVVAEQIDKNSLLIVAEDSDSTNITNVYMYHFGDKSLKNISLLDGKYVSHSVEDSTLKLELNNRDKIYKRSISLS